LNVKTSSEICHFSFFRRTCAPLLIVWSMMALAPSLFAQGPTTGSITGTVIDASGAVLANAKVTVTGPALVVPQTTLTNNQGAYRFPSLPPGSYSVLFEAPASNRDAARASRLVRGSAAPSI